MYYDFEDHRPDVPRVDSPLSVREGVLISIIVHLLVFIGIIFMPDLPQGETANPAVIAAEKARQEAPRFVFMQPPALQRPQPRRDVDQSDQDRVMSSREKPLNPQNPLPMARGNSRERELAEIAPPERGNQPESSTAGQPNPAEGQMASNDTNTMVRLPDMPGSTPALKMGEAGSSSGGKLGDALRNLQRYAAQQQSFHNPQGSGDAQGLIQFDSKGVDFGPWLARFVARVKSNWFIPQAAMIMKGHVVITFNIHRNGQITDIEVIKPSNVEAFNRAAVNALMASNPVQPLPREFPDESAFFTVTFLYNEDPADFR